VYVGIREIFSLHRQPASIKHTHQRITSPPAPIRAMNASQTQPSTSRTQFILVYSLSSLGHRTIRLGDRETRPSPSQTVQTPRASSRHTIFPFITPSLRPWAALAPVFQDLSPQLTRARLRSAESLNTNQPHSSRVPFLSSSQPARLSIWL